MSKKILAALLLLCASVTGLAPSASAEPTCDPTEIDDVEDVINCVTVDGVRQHQAALQAVADANGGNRQAGTPGYDASGAYVADQLEAAGYDVTIQPFDFAFFNEATPGTLRQTSPTPTTYVYGDPAGFLTMTYSGSGNVTATAEGVDLALLDRASSTSGCEPSDFAGFTAGNIAVMQRGACSFALKAANAEAAGAVGAIVFNQGNTPDRIDLFGGTLGAPGINIPTVSANFDLGVELAAGGVVANLSVDAISEFRQTFNVLAETEKGDPDNVVMVGAHLDSRPEGPGIQDNGSGSSAILELALQMGKLETKNQVRFAWWGAEELGLLGSENYVAELTQAEADRIALYLNFDMIGSPNYFFGIYDGDDSDGVGAGPGPEGSAQIEATFEAFYDRLGLPHQGTDFSGRSDYGPFIAIGIPAGGLFTGAEGIKTADEVVLYGGTAGEQYDQCYHLECDTFDNISLFALEVNSDAVAYATLTYAMDENLFDPNEGEEVLFEDYQGPGHDHMGAAE